MAVAVAVTEVPFCDVPVAVECLPTVPRDGQRIFPGFQVLLEASEPNPVELTALQLLGVKICRMGFGESYQLNQL